MKSSDLTYIDLFAGAGGLSEGFIRQGFIPVAHVEMDEKASHTLRTRIAYHYLKSIKSLKNYEEYLQGEISIEELYALVPEKVLTSVINQEINDANIKNIFNKIDDHLGEKKVDLIIGGPPCQAYSLIGRARDPNKMKNDPRNYLFKYYVGFLNKYMPNMFVFENVTGLLSAANGSYFKNMIQAFYDAGYETEYNILNASDYGVLQSRKRVIITGWKKGKKMNFPEIDKIENKWRIMDLLSDLPILRPGDNVNIQKYKNQKTQYLKQFSLRNGGSFVTQHITRPHNERDLHIYEIAIEKWLEDRIRLSYNDLPEKLKTHKNRLSFIDRFKVVDPYHLSHTLVAHLAKDGHYYIYPDLNQIRSLSVREAARIQSFPDDYFFEGGRSAAFKQIGNAVPPLMAEAIAKGIKKLL